MSHDLEHRAETELTQVPTQASVEAPKKEEALTPEPTPNRKRKGLLVKIGAPVAGLAIGTAAFLGLKGNGGEDPGTAPNDDPQGQEQVDPNGGNHEDDPTAEPTTPETQAPETKVETFPGTAIPESLAEAPDVLPTSIMKGEFYETLNDEQKARVDGWYDAIYTTGTFLQLPVEERLAAASYVFAANSAAALNRIELSPHEHIRTMVAEAGTPSPNNTPEEAVRQVDLYQTFAYQLAYDSDPSPDATIGTFDKKLAGMLLAGFSTTPEGQQFSIDTMNEVTSMVGYMREDIVTSPAGEFTSSDNHLTGPVTSELYGEGSVDLSFVTYTDINGEARGAWVLN